MFRREKEPVRGYDPLQCTPVIRCSICSGEQVAGFQDKRTGKIEEIMLLRGPEDLETFRKAYGITGEIKKVY